MKYGAMSSPLRDPREEIREFASMGFDFAELSMDPPKGLPENLSLLVPELKATLSTYGVGLVVHMPTFVWVADLTPRIRRASLEETVEALTVARSLGASYVVLHPGGFSGLGEMVREKSQQIALESLGYLIHSARELGMILAIENMFPKGGWLVTPEDFLGVMERFPELMMTLDVGHGFIKGGLQRVFSFIDRLGDRIIHVHMSDNWGERDDHLPIGAGRIPFSEVVSRLKHRGYEGGITLEVFSPDRDYLRISRDKLRCMWDEPSPRG